MAGKQLVMDSERKRAGQRKRPLNKRSEQLTMLHNAVSRTASAGKGHSIQGRNRPKSSFWIGLRGCLGDVAEPAAPECQS